MACPKVRMLERSMEIFLQRISRLDYLAGKGCAVCLSAAYKNSLVSFFLGDLYIDIRTD